METCVLGEERVTCGGEQEIVNDVYVQEVTENVFFLGMHLCAASVVRQVNDSVSS